MTKSEKYIKENPNMQMHLIPDKFGNGKQLIKFFYREQINLFNQGFLAYVDNQQWKKDRRCVMAMVEEYLVENEGIVDEEEFEGIEYLGAIRTPKFTEWFKEQFPKIDLRYGGVCYFSEVS